MGENGKQNQGKQGDISLESILAEFKGEAFIRSEKKTPKEDLDKATRQIVEETLGKLSDTPGWDLGMRQQPARTAPGEKPRLDLEAHADSPPQAPSPPPEAREERPPASAVLGNDAPTVKLPTEDIRAKPEEEKPAREEKWDMEPGKVIQVDFSRPEELKPEDPESAAKKKGWRKKREKKKEGKSPVTETAFTDSDLELTDYPLYADTDKMKDYAHLQDEADSDIDEEEKKSLFSGLFSRFSKDNSLEEELYEPGKELYEEEDEEEGQYDEEAFAQDELSLRQAAGKYGKGIGGYQIRGIATVFLALIMLLLTVLGDGDTALPGIMGSLRGLTAVLLGMLLAAMFLAAEVVTTGLMDILRRRMGAETLVTVAALASAADAIVVMLNEAGGGRGISYAAVVAFALGCALLGMKASRNAMKNTLRTAATGKSPYVVTSKLGALDDHGFVLFKARQETDGFVRKTEQMDFSEYVYSMAAPLLLLMSLVFAALAALGGTGEVSDILPNFAAMSAISASFTGLLAYGLPYGILARKLSKVGAALAGWGGAAEVGGATGFVVTDSDVFPTGTLSLAGVRVFRKTDAQRVISYTGSLIAASGSGLGKVFTDVIRQQKFSFYDVTDLVCHEGGGIVGNVNGEEVVVGSAGLMKLLGIHLPQNLNVKNAVFTAMKGELAGVFAINYVPLSSVQEALLSLRHTKIRPLFALRDFNVTPIMLQNKFNIATDKIDFLSYETRFALSSLTPDETARPFAVLAREGLGPLTDVVVGGKRFRRAVVGNTILSLASSLIGLLMLLSFFWTGAVETVSAANLFIYMGAWLFLLCVLSRTVRLD